MKNLSKIGEKVEKASEALSDAMEKSKTQYVFFAISSLFVLFSIAYGQYFFQTFLTFMYSAYVIHIHLARKLSFVESWKHEWQSFYHACLHIFCVMGFLIWIILIFKSFLIF